MADNTVSDRIVYFDWLRIAAIFLIMLLHTASFCWYYTDIHSSYWFILNIWKSLTDQAVLLFVMISGTLFLGREVPVRRLYSKYILRLAVAFVFWSLIYAVVSNYMWGVRSVLTVAFASHYHLWFLPMIIGLYICLPLLRLFVKTDRILKYFLILSFIFSFLIPQILLVISDFIPNAAEYIGPVHDRLDELGIHLVVGYSFYFLLGYFINKTDIRKNIRIIIYILGAMAAFVTIFLSTAQAYITGTALDDFHLNFNISVLLKALALFVLFKYAFSGRVKSPRLISRLSGYAFGAYLVHALVIEQLAAHLNLNAVSFNPLIAVPVIGIITFIVSFAVSALLNSIPFIKKYIV